MGSSTNFDPTGDKARKQATLKGAIIGGIFNAALGAGLGFIVLMGSVPQIYTATPDKKTGKPPPIPEGIWYWAGTAAGDWRGKESQLLAGQPVTIADGELNAWAQSVFKSTVPAPTAKARAPKAPTAKTPATAKPTSDIAKAKAGVKAAEAELKDFSVQAGTPNFHVFKDPKAPAGVSETFQVGLPFEVTILGQPVMVVYQARGIFVPGPGGPHFETYYSAFGNARIPVTPGLAQMVFNTLIGKFAADPAAKKYADAWAKYANASAKDGALALAVK